MNTFLFFLFGVILCMPHIAAADLATSTNFRLNREIIDVGGGRATSTSFNAEGSIGEPGTGISSSTSFILKGGFLYFEEPSAVESTPTPSSSPPSTPSSLGSTGFFGPRGLIFPEKKPPSPEEAIRACDFNDDGRCNLIDLSIMLFYYEDRGSGIARYDLSRNLIVDFPDISVLMFYWTG